MFNFSFPFFVVCFLSFHLTRQDMADEIHFNPKVILSWYKEMDVDMSKVTSLTVGTTYTFGFAALLSTLVCKQKWKFQKTIMHYSNINGDYCSSLATGDTYNFGIATNCKTILGSEICSTDKFTYDTITVVEEDDYQQLLLNHFKSGSNNYLFPDYEFDESFSKLTQLDIRYAYSGTNSFTKKIWMEENNDDILDILPQLHVGDTISIVIFNSNKLIAFAAKDCVVINYPHIFTSRYHVLKGYEHHIRFSFDISLNVFDVAVKSGNTELGSKTRSQNINYVDIAVDNSKLSIGEHVISFTYKHKYTYVNTANFTLNVYDNKNQDFFLFNNDFSYCQYVKSNSITFTGYFREDLNIKDTSPFVISGSLFKNGSWFNNDITLSQDETNKRLYTFTIKEGFLNAATSIDIYLYENNDSTYPLYTTTFTVTKPSLSSNVQTYASDLKGNLHFNDLTCPLQNIMLKSRTNESETITINCDTDNNSSISCPYTLLKGYDEFDVYIENKAIDYIEIMRQIESAQFIIENQNFYEMNKDNKIKIKSTEYYLKYINEIQVNYNNSIDYIITSHSNGVRFSLNTIKNEITVIMYSEHPGVYQLDKLVDVNGKKSTFQFNSLYKFVNHHFILSNNYTMKSSYFNSFETELAFDSALNSKDYMNFLYLDDATYTCSNTNQNKLTCSFSFANVLAPRDFKISLFYIFLSFHL